MNKTKEAVFTTAFLAVLLGVASVGYSQTAEKCDPADKDCPKAGKEVAKTEVKETKPQAADADLKAAVSADVPKSVSAESKKTEAILSAPPKPNAADGSAQTQTPEQDAQALAKKLANPVASLISLPRQNNVDFGMGPNEDGFRYTLNVQPVTPIALNKDWNLISRTIVPIIGQTIPMAPASRSFMTIPGSRQGARAIGNTHEARMAWSIGSASP